MKLTLHIFLGSVLLMASAFTAPVSKATESKSSANFFDFDNGYLTLNYPERDRLLDYALEHNIEIPHMGAAFEGCSNCEWWKVSQFPGLFLSQSMMIDFK